MSFLEAVLWPALGQLPVLAAWFTGAVLAALHVRERPALRWAIAAFVILGVTRVVGSGLTVWLPGYMAEQDLTAGMALRMQGLVGVYVTGLETVGWGCLLAGMFSRPAGPLPSGPSPRAGG